MSGTSANPLDRAQTGALGTRVRGHFVCARSQRSAGQHANERIASSVRRETWAGAVRSASSPDHRANVSFTMRSSSEWYASTSTRPFGPDHVHRLVEAVGEVRELAVDLHADRLEGAARRDAARGGASAAGIASRTTSASSRVVRSGRAATIACAMRRANRSSPYCAMTRRERGPRRSR